jgi:Protein containing a metal-binding domain shared with formylmethanofuran dehydrogenase subunit E
MSSKNGGFFGNIQSIANAWRVNPRYDQLITFLFHDHACPGVQPGFFISDMVFENFPLSPDEEYFYMAASIYCKDDSLVYLMGVSPGMGSYMNQRLINEETASEFLPGGTEEGILVIWDKKNNIGRAVVLNFKWPTLDNTGLTTSEAQRENSIHYFVNSYNDLPYDRAITPYTQAVSDFRWITSEEFANIKKGGLASGSSLAYLKGLPADRTRDDLIPVQGGSQTGGSTSQGTSTGTSTGSNGSSSGSGWSKYSSGSVGETGTAVNAATETTTTEAGAQPAGDTGKSYEVTQAGTQNTDETPWGTYAVVGIISVLALGAVGFFFKGSLFGR